MSTDLQNVVISFFIIFCRIGGALVLMPGFSNPRFPTVVRLMFSMVLSVALTPYLWTYLQDLQVDIKTSHFIPIIAVETAIGLMFGFWCFCFLHASRFAGTFISTAVGLAGIPGQPIDEQNPSSHLASLLSLTATMLIFASGLHLVSVRALIQTYQILPMGKMPGSLWMVNTTLQLLRETSILALQISSPFILLVVVSNFALGLINRFTPQLSVYFAVTGLVSMISLGILSLASPQLLSMSEQSYSNWLQSGFK